MATILNAVSGTGLTQTSDGSGVLVLQGAGVTGLTVDSTGAYGQLKSGTPQNTTSGTAIDFTGIPSWVKRITVMLNGVSTNGTSSKLIQLGTSGGIQTTTYLGSESNIIGTVGSSVVTSGFGIRSVAAADIINGLAVFAHIGNNIWVANGLFGLSNTNSTLIFGGAVTLSGILDRIRLTTVNGTDTFDAGSVNILYEG